MTPKTYTVTCDQMKELDVIRQTLYMLSREPWPRPVNEQICAAAWKLYDWLQQFAEPIPLREYAKQKEQDGTIIEWPEDCDELWEAHK